MKAIILTQVYENYAWNEDGIYVPSFSTLDIKTMYQMSQNILGRTIYYQQKNKM